MTTRTLVALAVVATLAVGAGCGDDSDDSAETGPADPPTSTTSTTMSGPTGGLPPDRPADLVGEVTDSDGGRILVEEQPGSPDAGRKAWVAIEGTVYAEVGDRDPTPVEPSEVEVGQRVSAWTGICAQSYPEQCAAEALLIE